MRCVIACVWAGLRGAVAALLVLGFTTPSLAQGHPRPATVRLEQGPTVLDAQELGAAWIDETGNATLEQVMQWSPARFRPTRPDLIYSLGEHGVLWLHYRLVRGHDESRDWLLSFPMPSLDRVTVYQQSSKGQWLNQTAGDTIAVAAWPEPGRYPYFRLDLPHGQTRDIYVRIRHLTSANFPVQLLTEAAHHQHIQLEYLGLGLTFGALMLLIVACLAQGLVYRDGIHGWYALFASMTTISVAAYTGTAAHLLWPGFGALGDSLQGCLALLAGASALLFVRKLTGLPVRCPMLDRAVYWAALAGAALAGAFPMLAKTPGLVVLAMYVGGAVLVNMWIAVAAWRRGDVVGAWVLLAHLPLSIAVGMALLRPFGWLPISFGTQYAIVVAMAIEVPLLLVPLNIRSRERHGVQMRELALVNRDPLTGLLASHLFHDRLQQIIARHKRHKENAAIVFIDLVNYPRIKDFHGSAVAEQSLLRSVIKLRRLVRDVDTVSRVGEARFGLILEGVTSRIAVTDRAARLIAAGLMPLKGLKPEVTLQFHVAAVLLTEWTKEPAELVNALGTLLDGMSARTRRPIRFLEPETIPSSSDVGLVAAAQKTMFVQG